MTELNLTPIEPVLDPAEGAPGGPGQAELGAGNMGVEALIERVRDRARRFETEREVLLPLPKYDGLLAARYRKLHWSDLTEIREGADTLADYNADLLIRACVEVVLVDDDGTQHRPYSFPLTLGMNELLDLVGRPHGNSARENLRSLFDGDDMMWITHAGILGQWFTTGVAEGAILGES